ncbi:hypothetical protein ACET3Z_018284 [Daucus carota]
MLRTSKQERDALFAARRKLADALSFLRSKGFSEEQIYEAQIKDGFGSKPLVRDEFGLPVAPKESIPSREVPVFAEKANSSSKNGDPFTAKLKGKLDDNVADVPKTGSLGSGNVKDSKPKLWSQVVKEASPPSVSSRLSYKPPLDGESVVTPPDEVLREGINKLKFTIVGSFTKGTASFSKVHDFANVVWKGKGLVHVGQKDSRTFIFRFSSEEAVHSALARGTWKWVRKSPVNPPSEPPTSSVPHPAPAKDCTEYASPVKGPTPAAGIDIVDCSDNSATPTNTFKNLRNVDEKDLKQKFHPDAEGFRPSKSQRKRLKRAQGKSPSNPS